MTTYTLVSKSGTVITTSSDLSFLQYMREFEPESTIVPTAKLRYAEVSDASL